VVFDIDSLKWDGMGLISVIFQDHATGEVLVLAYMNREALQKTLATGRVHLFRRSHGKVMAKGETSGNYQLVREVLLDCDADALVMKIEQVGGAACHEGYRSCFFRRLEEDQWVLCGERVFDPEEVYGQLREPDPLTQATRAAPCLGDAGRRPCIAIDGPVAAGKSTIARLVARALGYALVDSGAMYRALAWAAAQRGLGAHDGPAAVALLDNLEIRFLPLPEGGNQVLVGGQEVSEMIRTEEIGRLASQLSELPEVRRRMVARQQAMASRGGVVMEGRDIQTVVLPDAEVKVFLTASPEERARRRCDELLARGVDADYGEVLADLKQRDRRDESRAHAPLRAAPEAVCICTDGLSIQQVVDKVLAIARS